ncbi:MAG: hypothetical protein RLZZ419_1425, partial [Pseudomonadota bacterium]
MLFEFNFSAYLKPNALIMMINIFKVAVLAYSCFKFYMQTYSFDNSLSVDRFFNLQLESWLSSFNRQVQSSEEFAHQLQP